MSEATDMLAKAKARYEQAKRAETEFASGGGRRRVKQFDLAELRADYLYWKNQVDMETRRLAGQAGRRPFQVGL
jgi:hypothetical protein